MQYSDQESDDIDISQQIEKSQVEKLQSKKRRQIQFSQERYQKNSNFIQFSQFFDMVKDIPIDFPYVLEYFNLNLSEFPHNEEILNIQKVLQYRTSLKVKKNWTKDEQKLLIWIICKYAAHYQINIQSIQDQHFKEISNFFLFRNQELIKQKWNSYMKINLNEKPFTQEEDLKLIELHDKYQFEPQNNIWAQIAGQLNQNGAYYRSSKQLRERWINYLDPTLLKINLKWTDKEDLELINQIKQKGRKWTEIAKYLQRNENQVKNRYISLIKREGLQKDELDKLIDKLLWKISKQQQDNEEIIEYTRKKQINQEILHLSIHQLDLHNLEMMQLNKQLTPCLVNIKNNKIYFPPYDFIKTIIDMQQITMKDDFDKARMQIEKFDSFELKFQENQIYKTSLSIIEEEQIEQFNSERYILIDNDIQNEFDKQKGKQEFLGIKSMNNCYLQYTHPFKFRTEYIIRQQIQKQIYRSLPQIINACGLW